MFSFSLGSVSTLIRWSGNFCHVCVKTFLPVYNSAKIILKNTSRFSRVMITDVLPPFYGLQFSYVPHSSCGTAKITSAKTSSVVPLNGGIQDSLRKKDRIVGYEFVYCLSSNAIITFKLSCHRPIMIIMQSTLFSQTWLRYVWLMAWHIRLSVCRLSCLSSVTCVHPTQGFNFSGIFLAP